MSSICVAVFFVVAVWVCKLENEKWTVPTADCRKLFKYNYGKRRQALPEDNCDDHTSGFWFLVATERAMNG